MSEIEYRLYPDGTVLHEDEYPEDCADFRSDDYSIVSIPDEIVSYISEQELSDLVKDNSCCFWILRDGRVMSDKVYYTSRHLGHPSLEWRSIMEIPVDVVEYIVDSSS